jgi:microcompartment protein CcmL/EutN
MVEFHSIAVGIHASDAMVKAASIDLFQSRPISPGRYISLLTGEVAAVEASVHAAVQDAGNDAIVESFVLANLHENVLPFLQGKPAKPSIEAAGVIETSTAASIVLAIDAACKTSPVAIVRLHLANHIGGKGYTVFTGAIADVQASIDAACAVAKQNLIAHVAIPNPDADFHRYLTETVPW